MPRILCVDDSRHIRNMVQRLLPKDFEFFGAAEGQEALEFMNTMDFDVVLLDMVMPGMDGFSMLRHLRARKSKTPVLLFTSLSDQKKIKQAQRLGVADFILKPCDHEFLKEKLIFVATNHGVEIQEGMGEFAGVMHHEDDDQATVVSGSPLEVLDIPPEARRERPVEPILAPVVAEHDELVSEEAYGFFVVQQVSHGSRIFELYKNTIRIGRGKSCDLVLGGDGVSRKHSIFTKRGREMTLTDLDSSNGTIVNGREIREHQLSHDDQIRIGRYFLTFKTYNYEVMSDIEKYSGMEAHKERPAKVEDATQMMKAACVDAFVAQFSIENDMVLMSMDFEEECYPVHREKFELGTRAMACPDLDGGTGVFIEFKDGAHLLTRRLLKSIEVFVNGESVRKKRLDPGDVMALGGVEFAYQFKDTDS